MSKLYQRLLAYSTLLIILLIASYFTIGLFVIQPIGMLPEGATIVYFRLGTSMPFIASADGMLDKTETGVSLFGRGIAMATILSKLQDKKIMTLPYSNTFYLISTGGKTFEK